MIRERRDKPVASIDGAEAGDPKEIAGHRSGTLAGA